ncbi:unnamed protein product [Owenia fusiformis]|uniref:Uncharacterized protein n=1 Tax=Owenia fusiformis TaxID=6347 RepID=A0A8J1UWG7_OWEFU|nr:unnamed protein product [Owenia fusiformis]
MSENLSLLSRGVGQIHRIDEDAEKIEVKYEPEDYYNWTDNPDRMFLPPIHIPRVAFQDTTPRSDTSITGGKHFEAHLPKTFTTRKGAMLLFSENLAMKNKSAHRPVRTTSRKRRKNISKSLDDFDVNLNTVGDLTKEILAFGGDQYGDKENDNGVYLGFVHKRRRDPYIRPIRPGYSAKRYLPSLTKSFDDSVLEKLTNKGQVTEQSLFHNNLLIPWLKKRYNPDLTVEPPPYRLMRQWLRSPGNLTGYTFYKTQGDEQLEDGGNLMSLLGDYSERPDTRATLKVAEILPGGSTREVTYASLDNKTKESVITDLLVKSALNHAMKKQQQIFEEGLSRVAESNFNSGQNNPDMSDNTRDQLFSPLPKFSMQEAVKSLFDTPTEKYDGPEPSKKMKGKKIPPHSAKSHEAHGKEWPQTGDKEYMGNIPIASLKDTSSNSSRRSSVDNKFSALSPELSMIPDLDEKMVSREGHFPVLPPIAQAKISNVQFGVGTKPLPEVEVEPPTPQNSSMGFSNKPGGPTRDNTFALMRDKTMALSESPDEEEVVWGGAKYDEAAILKKAEEDAMRQQQQVPEKVSIYSFNDRVKDLGSSTGDLSIGGPSGMHDLDPLPNQKLKTHNTGWRGSNKSLNKSKDAGSVKGSIVLGPGGEAIDIGGHVASPLNASDSVLSAVRQANKLDTESESDDQPDWNVMVTKVEKQVEQVTTAPAAVVRSRKSSLAKSGGPRAKTMPETQNIVSVPSWRNDDDDSPSLQSVEIEVGFDRASSPYSAAKLSSGNEASSGEETDMGGAVTAAIVTRKPSMVPPESVSRVSQIQKPLKEKSMEKPQKELQKEKSKEMTIQKEKSKMKIKEKSRTPKEQIKPNTPQSIKPKTPAIEVDGYEAETEELAPPPPSSLAPSNLDRASIHSKSPHLKPTSSRLPTRSKSRTPKVKTPQGFKDDVDDYFENDIDDEFPTSRVGSEAASESQLGVSQGKVSTISEKVVLERIRHSAKKIAEDVVSKGGKNLEKDALLAADNWLRWHPPRNISRPHSLAEEAMNKWGETDSKSVKSAFAGGLPTHEQYKEVLKESLASALSSTGDKESDIGVDNIEVADEVIDALITKELEPEDIELVKDEESGLNIVRIKSSATEQPPTEYDAQSEAASSHHTEATKSVLSVRSAIKSVQSMVEQSVHSAAQSIHSDARSVHSAGDAESVHSGGSHPSTSSHAASNKTTGSKPKSIAKSGHVYKKPSETGSISSKVPASIPGQRADNADLELDIINYGEGEEEKKSSAAASNEQEEDDDVEEDSDDDSVTDSVIEAAKSLDTATPDAEKTRIDLQPEGASLPADQRSVAKSRVSFRGEPEPEKAESDTDFKSQIEDLVKETGLRVKSVKSAKSAKSVASKGSKGSSKKKEEFVVGKVPDKKELETLYAPVEPPPPPKQEKSKVKEKTIVKPTPAATPAKTPAKTPASKKSKRGKKGKKEQPAPEKIVKEPTKEKIKPEPVKKAPTPPPEAPKEADPPPREEETPSPEFKRELTKELSFVIVRDEYSDDEDAIPKQTLASRRPTINLPPPPSSNFDTDDDTGSETSSNLKNISNKEARAAKRAAAAERRRREVEKRRKEREDQLKKEREEIERKEKMKRDLEEERRMKEEERRLAKEALEAAERREDEEREERQRREEKERERNRRLKEEYERKLEETRRQHLEEEQRRMEALLQKQRDDEVKRREEEMMLYAMAEQERIEYEKKKKLEEERKKKEEEELRIKREEEARLKMEEAMRLAEEMERKKMALEERMKFARGLMVESKGLEHSQDVSRAFVFSYYELLQWLGLDLPEFEKQKKEFDLGGGH